VQTIDRSIILGDHLIVTNRDRLERAVKTSAVDGFIMKPNQVGTVAEALDCFEYASQNAILTIPSGRSAGVIDDVVMDLAVGLGARRSRRTARRGRASASRSSTSSCARPNASTIARSQTCRHWCGSESCRPLGAQHQACR
jgi:enolase